MYRRSLRSNRTTLYIAIAFGVVISGLLVYGLAQAVTQSSLALVAGLILLVGNAPELIRTLRQREVGLAMMNTLVGIALVSYFMVQWLGSLFYIPLAVALLLALPLVVNRVKIAQTYLSAIRSGLGQIRNLALGLLSRR